MDAVQLECGGRVNKYLGRLGVTRADPVSKDAAQLNSTGWIFVMRSRYAMRTPRAQWVITRMYHVISQKRTGKSPGQESVVVVVDRSWEIV